MAFELIYTSAPQGIRPGSSGFCTVAMTDGMPPALLMRLETLTGYRHLYGVTDSRYAQNPPSFIHYRLKQKSAQYDILGRICSCAPDHTGRSNKLAHFLVATPQEIEGLPAGPAAYRDANSPFVTEWTGRPRVIGAPHALSALRGSAGMAQRWAEYMGDAGWAGELAQSFIDNPQGRTFILFDPARHTSLLELVDEAIQLLPERLRWKVTYNTYGTSMPTDMLCNWTFCLPEPEARRAAGAIGNVKIINLCAPVACSSSGALQERARTGRVASGAAPSPTLHLSLNTSANEVATPRQAAPTANQSLKDLLDGPPPAAPAAGSQPEVMQSNYPNQQTGYYGVPPVPPVPPAPPAPPAFQPMSSPYFSTPPLPPSDSNGSLKFVLGIVCGLLVGLVVGGMAGYLSCPILEQVVVSKQSTSSTEDGGKGNATKPKDQAASAQPTALDEDLLKVGKQSQTGNKETKGKEGVSQSSTSSTEDGGKGNATKPKDQAASAQPTALDEDLLKVGKQSQTGNKETKGKEGVSQSSTPSTEDDGKGDATKPKDQAAKPPPATTTAATQAQTDPHAALSELLDGEGKGNNNSSGQTEGKPSQEQQGQAEKPQGQVGREPGNENPMKKQEGTRSQILKMVNGLPPHGAEETPQMDNEKADGKGSGNKGE